MKVIEKSWLQMICFEIVFLLKRGRTSNVFTIQIWPILVEISALNTDLNRLAGNDISVLN